MTVTPAAAQGLIRDACGVEATVSGPLVTVPVAVAEWHTVARFARESLGCLYFSWLSAIDWKEQGLEVVCRVENLGSGLAVMLRTRLGADARCPSVVPVWKGADWMERECYDMFGVVFDGHPDLRRILLTEEWVGGPPLRKDFVDAGFAPYR